MQSNFFYGSACAGIISGPEQKANAGIRKDNKGHGTPLQAWLPKCRRYHPDADVFPDEIRNDPL